MIAFRHVRKRCMTRIILSRSFVKPVMSATTSNLKVRKVGGLDVPIPGFGGMGMSMAYGTVNDEESKEVLRHCIKLGCTFFDTADMYGGGHNERLIGSVLKEGDNRSKVFLATKFGQELEPGTGRTTGAIRGDVEYVKRALKDSIERLGCTPDLYYQHRIDPSVNFEETYTAIDQLRKEGHFKYFGVSECSAETLRKITKYIKVDAIQVEYSPWTTDIERNGILQTARELKIPIVAYSPLGRGFLTGRWRKPEEFGPDDRRPHFPRFAGANFEANFKLVETLEAIAKKKGVTAAQLCIAWVMAQGEDIIPIPGTKSIGRLEENWKSRDILFTDEELKQLREVVDQFTAVGTRYPEMMMKHVEV